ncbi:zinc finger protein 525-like isoform X1 [Cryptotermes secundus]|uniref:zinc finger protein 525-like isoform X1 n=1 Tax=Cryptotermes secundus TaxID=105785 RepID=UPI000CD7D01C|nr:zinc finger protein 525-like isoform X1 [Cryptotermes secundus]
MCEEGIQRLQRILHRRVPRVLLQRAEEIFPSLRETMNLADSVEARSLCSEIHAASSHDASQVNSVKAEEVSDAEEEKYPVPITFQRIKAEPENLADSVEARSLCSEIHPASSHDASQVNSVKAEEVSDAEEEKCPVPITFQRIKAEPESTLNDLQPVCSGERRYSCDECDKSFTEQCNLRAHQCETHQPIHSGERPYCCDMCTKSFSQQGSLKIHQRIHSGERPFCCDVCTKSFSFQSGLREHLRIHSGERPFCCDVCAKSFCFQSGLRKHLRIHSGERPFCCDVCTKSFRQQGSLKRHQLLHSGERSFCCDMCTKSFSHLSSLKVHQRIHSGERPFCCDVCNKSFSDRRCLRKHLCIHSGEQA